ncbi:MAG: serine/threonine protein kinase [Candidatus Aureabacteria bacterium]|nr:serine/threonine protein kinase [Candidatus Auribacterota bacterium]
MEFRKYYIVKKIGHGTFSEVYEVKERETGEHFALKLFKPMSNSGSNAKKKFLCGARVAKKIKGENIIRVFDICSERDSVFYVMELVDGCRLKDAIADKSLRDIRLTLDIMISVASGVNAIHKAGFIHRDMKPENILLTREKKVKIIDFGLAVPRKRFFWNNFNISGSPSYISPDQILNKRVDERCDIYSIGIIFYEMLTGNVPFTGSSREEVYRLHLNPRSLPKPLPRSNDKNTDKLESIVLKCLDKDKNKRYPNAGFVIRDLNYVKSLY